MLHVNSLSLSLSLSPINHNFFPYPSIPLLSFSSSPNMTFPSFLLILLLSLVSLHAMPKCGDSRLENMRASTMYIHKLLVEGDHVQRKVLHEVHSGPNPIGNSFPKQNCKTKLQRIP